MVVGGREATPKGARNVPRRKGRRHGRRRKETQNRRLRKLHSSLLNALCERVVL